MLSEREREELNLQLKQALWMAETAGAMSADAAQTIQECREIRERIAALKKRLGLDSDDALGQSQAR